MTWRVEMAVLVAGALVSCTSPSSNSNSSRAPAGDSCTTAVATAPTLRKVSTANLSVPGNPFDVVATADGRWSFVTVNNAVEVLSNNGDKPIVTSHVSLPGDPSGEQLSHDGRYLLVADGSGAVIMDAARTEAGVEGAVLGILSSPGGQGAIEVALSLDDHFVFVALEVSDSMAVFDLQKAFDQDFGPADFVGTVPLGGAPVGLAISPDGRWIYATSELSSARTQGSPTGTLTAIDLNRAETSPGTAVAVTVFRVKFSVQLGPEIGWASER